MFCDLVGSTALAQRLDPEELRELMRAYQQACGGVIARYDGHVAQYLGDGLMVYFGCPRAHEDDAERAVRAGAARSSPRSEVPAPRSPASTHRHRHRPGRGRRDRRRRRLGAKAAVGETPNLAARLQALAGPDEIVIAPSTHRLLGDSFEFEDLGDHTLKGIDEPVRALARHRRAQAREPLRRQRTRGASRRSSDATSEVALLLDRWEQARDGEGQVVLLSASPASARAASPRRCASASQPCRTRGCATSARPTTAALRFYPIISQLERAAGFERDDTPAGQARQARSRARVPAPKSCHWRR